MAQPKSESELRSKLAEMLAIDARIQPDGMTRGGMVFSKVAACKALLWALGENDDDRWFILSAPGPAIDSRVKNRN